MKVVSLLLAVLVIFTTVTAGGSQVRAGVTSPAFDHCLRVPGSASCRPGVRTIAAAEEFGANAGGDVYGGVDARDGGGHDLSSPDFWQEVLAAVVRAGLVELARQVALSVIGGSQPQPDLEAVVRDNLFDPRR